MIYQIQYRVRGRKSTVQLIARARSAFAAGRPLPEGVEVHPIAWTGSLDRLKAALRSKRAFVGQAGIVKQYAEADLTMCDYDGAYRPSLGLIARIARMLGIWPLWLREDKTARGWHILIKWNRDFAPVELVALQCILGSDVQRETYNLARVLSGKTSERWNLLFERKLNG
jgi:hypothetical protein